MGKSFFQLNNDKIETSILARAAENDITKQLGSLSTNVQPSVRILGVIFASSFKFDK